MPIPLPCRQCHKPLLVLDQLAGQQIRCPHCQAVLQVPSPPAASPADDLALMPVGYQVPGRESGARPCPSCGNSLPEAIAICNQCGYNVVLQKRMPGFRRRRGVPWTQHLQSALGYLILLGLVAGGCWFAYYQYRQYRPLPTPPAAPPAPAAAGPGVPPPPANPAASLLVVSNQRFPVLAVFASHSPVALGEVKLGESRKFPLPASSSTPLILSGEVRGWPAGLVPSRELKEALNQGILWTGSAAEGLELFVSGPPPGLLPKAGEEVLKNPKLSELVLLPGGEQIQVKQVRWHDRVLKPVPPQTYLQLAFKQVGPELLAAWQDQDVLIEAQGQAVYRPALPPFKTRKARLATVNGELDLEPPPALSVPGPAAPSSGMSRALPDSWNLPAYGCARHRLD